MTGATPKPQLSSKTRLRFDRASGRYMLLYPERGLELNRTAGEIVCLCTGERTVEDIARHLALVYADMPAVHIEREVRRVLDKLARRGLLRGPR